MRRGLAAPGKAAAARLAGSRTLRPKAARAARSGTMTLTRAPRRVKAAPCDRALARGPPPAATGARTTTRPYPAARSALALECTPPSIHRCPPMLTGGHTPGTAQLALTASTRPAPLVSSKAVRRPVTASTAVIISRRAGQSWQTRRRAIASRRPGPDAARAVMARRPIRTPKSTASRERSAR